MTRSLFILVMAGAMFAMNCSGADDQEITGREAEAISLAVQTFKSSRHPSRGPNDIVYGDLKHYITLLERHADELEVIFVPQPSPRPPNIPKGQAWLEFGGSTAYGSEVHYHISLRKMKILKETYGK